MVNVKSGSKITLTVGGKSNEIEITDNMTVNDLVKKYFAAYVNADFTTLETIATPISDKEKSSQTSWW